MKFLRMTENGTPSLRDEVLSGLLSEFRERVAVMRSLGVVQWGDIVLGPEPVSPPARGASPPDSPAQEQDNDYVTTLLHSSGANPGPFLRKVGA